MGLGTPKGFGDPLESSGPTADGLGGGCFADMLQLINTSDNDFSGLFDSPFGAPDSTVPPGLPPAPSTLGTYLGPSNPPPAAPQGNVYPGPPGLAPFTPQPPAPLLPAPGPPTAPGVKEEPSAVPSSQPQPGVMLPPPSFVPASPGQFSPQPLVGFQNQHGFPGEDFGVHRGGGRGRRGGQGCLILGRGLGAGVP